MHNGMQKAFEAKHCNIKDLYPEGRWAMYRVWTVEFLNPPLGCDTASYQSLLCRRLPNAYAETFLGNRYKAKIWFRQW